jgi:hypothetical protein
MRFYPLEIDISFSGNEVKRVSTDYTSSEPLEEYILAIGVTLHIMSPLLHVKTNRKKMHKNLNI